METQNIHDTNAYDVYNAETSHSLYKLKDISKKSELESKNQEKRFHEVLESEKGSQDKRRQAGETKESYPVQIPVETDLSFSIEDDLKIIVTTISNKDTKEVIRKIPSEGTIKALKNLYKYKEPNVTKGHQIDEIFT
ncbi:MAG: flagellar protein FlaG [Candidatus Brocadiaceae bacterium]|nr:flagellar protein FlaG [Candidatus Brocadiaceae bacterium]